MATTAKEDAMNRWMPEPEVRNIAAVTTLVLRIMFSVMLWTLGSGMAISLGAEPAKEQRKVYTFAVDRAQAENLQRWVNQGHDTWCRDAQLVASATMRRLGEEFEEAEAASLPLEMEQSERVKAVYTFHSLNGKTTYRITVRRFEWLRESAGTLHRMIWVPESVEITTRATLD